MKKRIRFLIIAVMFALLTACAAQKPVLWQPATPISTQSPQQLDIAPSDMAPGTAWTKEEIMRMAGSAGASNFYGATSRTSGGSGSLDSIDGTNLAEGDVCYTVEDGNFFVHRLNATSGAAELDPDIITPDSNAGNKRWILVFQGNPYIVEIAQLTPSNGNIIVGDGSTWVAESGATARASLGLSIGSDVQSWDDDLDDLAGLTPTDGNIIVGDGSDWTTESGATARASLGLSIGSDVQSWDDDLDDLAGLTPTDGNIIVGDGSDWTTESGATARASLGLSIGSDVQSWDDDLDDLAGLTPTDGNIIVGDGSDWTTESGATARASLGLGTGDTPEFTGVTVSDGGTTGVGGAKWTYDDSNDAISTTGKVGVGTSSPDYELEVDGILSFDSDTNFSGGIKMTSVTVANASTIDYSRPTEGFFFIRTNFNEYAFGYHAANSFVIILQDSGDFSTTSGTASKINLYKTGSPNYYMRIQNNIGGSRVISCIILK